MSLPRVPWHVDELMAALAPVDQAFHASEGRWGVGRLERLVSEGTLGSYRRGWVQWRQAIDSNDLAGIREVGPKMIAALAYMACEAEAAEHADLSVETWECLMADGRVLVVVRSTAEASAIARAAGLELDGTLPPDLIRIVEHQRAGRELVVWTLGEIARVLQASELINCIKHTWPGATIISGPITRENDISDWATADPIRAIIEEPAAPMIQSASSMVRRPTNRRRRPWSRFWFCPSMAGR